MNLDCKRCNTKAGGARPGAGRPRKGEAEKKQRPQHQVRAWADEWDIIKRFSKLVKSNGKNKCERMIEELERIV